MIVLNSFRNENKIMKIHKIKFLTKKNINQKNLQEILKIKGETNYVKKRKTEDNK